jgi:hypothetical protein
MIFRFLSVLFMPVVCLFAYAKPDAQAERIDFLKSWLPGEYLLIGKAVDSDRTYHGLVEISATDGKLEVSRHIEGSTIRVIAEIVQQHESLMIQIGYSADGKDLVEHCQISSVGDNYPRLTCYVRKATAETTRPGLEALFYQVPKP